MRASFRVRIFVYYAVLSLHSISMQFGERVLFRDVSLTLGAHDRTGLVGPNGAGKSTLLKIIAGISQPDRGSIGKAGYVTVGYLPQDGVVESDATLIRESETAFEDILEVQDEIREAESKLNTLDPESGEYADTLEVYGELQHKLEDLDAFRMHSKIERILMGLGFSVDDFQRPCREFSGGWQMRIALAKLLLREPSVLLLDEPTNHLDLESLQWLENYLKGYNGAVILVSHDRALLDTLTTRTIAITLGRIEVYSGNYSFYETESALRRELQVNAARNQQRQIEHAQKFIDRFRYKATKARQVQSRIKMLEKMEIVEVDGNDEDIHFRFPPPPASGAVVMELRNVTKRYGTHTIFTGLSSSIDRGDRIAIVGVNGAGKSTFSRILAGIEPFESGERIPGHNVVLSYFAQHQAEELDPAKEALEIIDDVAVGEIRTKLRTILGAFLFHGDDVFKKVSVLSGGEKSRLALAKMLLQPANFLIMDEPTNHLDMRSKAVLQEALGNYEGTFLIVSHDRAFLDQIINKVIEISPGGRVRVFPGNVSGYLEKKRAEQEAAVTAGRPENRRTATATTAAPELSMKERKRIEAEQRQKRYKLLKPFKDRLAAIEKEISVLEIRKKEVETEMASPEFYRIGDAARETARQYREIKSKLDGFYAEWEEISAQISSLESAAEKS